jgi:Tol biopolymer transport system component
MIRTLLVLTTVAGLWLAPAATASFPGRNGRLAWTGNFGGCSEIRVFSRDLSREERSVASSCSGGLSAPAFSPNGRRLLFASSESERGRLLTVGLDGRTPRRLPLRGFNPTWSPDGRHVAYTEGPGGGRLWRARRDGTHRKRLLRRAAEPRWSPKRGQLAYLTYPDDGGAELHLANSFTGRRLRTLSSSAWLFFDFSPDGERVVYSQPFDTPYEDPCGLYTVPTDGHGEPVKLPGGPCGAESVAWSPDGSLIAFVTSRLDEDEQPWEELWTIPAEGGRAKLAYSTDEGNIDESVGGRMSWQPLPPL